MTLSLVTQSTSQYSVYLLRGADGNFGVHCDRNQVIEGIAGGSPAEKNGQIGLGDKLCSINGIEILAKPTQKKFNEQIRNITKNCGSAISLVIAKRGKFQPTYISTSHSKLLLNIVVKNYY